MCSMNVSYRLTSQYPGLHSECKASSRQRYKKQTTKTKKQARGLKLKARREGALWEQRQVGLYRERTYFKHQERKKERKKIYNLSF